MNCPGGETVPQQHALAECLTADDSGVYVPTPARKAPVVLYVDRSASMKGFLDPGYSTGQPTDYRLVILKVLVALHPVQAFSFGSSIVPISPSLAALSTKSFYSDGNTQLEDVVTQIEKDTAMSQAYVIVTDGRRGSPQSAIRQYEALGAIARDWVAKGGSFLVAAGMSGFQPVEGDPSGCQEQGGESALCPLYAFALAPPGGERWLAGALAIGFSDLFAWPAIRAAGDEIVLTPSGPQTGVQFAPGWPTTRLGTPMTRSTSSKATTQWTRLNVNLRDSTTSTGMGVSAALRGQGSRVVISSRGFAAGPPVPWMNVTGLGLIKAADVPLAIDVVSHGPGGPASLYRVDFLPTGLPSWLEEFDSSDAADKRRTYGLSKLFEAFRQQALDLTADASSLARFYIVGS